MSRSELHNWECAIEKLSGDNADKMLAIAQDIYNTAFVRGKNYISLEKTKWIPCSEQLPEYRKMVDVTTRDLRVELAYLDSIKEDGTDDLWIIPLEDAECALWNIVAWKPRPEPWKGEDNECL